MLKSLLDISKWNISNAKNMNGVFIRCSSLEYIPDISNWNTSNVENMYGIFATGYSMNSKNDMFFKCDSLMSNNEQSEQDSSIYKRDGHSSLKKIPDISKWNIDNITNISCMFANCSSLEYLPDISKWNTNKLNNIRI